MTTTSQITVSELVSLDNGRGINFSGAFAPTFNGVPFGAGAAGTPGLNNATILLFTSNDTGIPPLLPTADITYTFTTRVATGLTGGWSTTLPNNGDMFRWMTSATASSTTSTDTIPPSEWAPVALVSRDGYSGYNTARIYIYVRSPSGSTPALPSADVNYTFSTSQVTGLTNSWTTTIPSGPNPLWVAAASAVSLTNSDTIGPTEWTAPAIMAQNGNDGQGTKGDTGNPGASTVTLNLYTWSTVQPLPPTGTTSYNWASGMHSGDIVSGLDTWTSTVPSNIGGPGLRLWIVSQVVSSTTLPANDTINWAGQTPSPLVQNGEGFSSTSIYVYKWSISLPSGPVGEDTYRWSTSSVITGGYLSTPGWNLIPNSDDKFPGFTLWRAEVRVMDSMTAGTTTFNWGNASISAVGYAGDTGPAGSTDLGAQGASARLAFKKYPSGTSPSPAPDPYVVAGDSLPPANTWDSTGVSWSTSVPSLGPNESLYQANGIYNPATTQTSWSAPYLASLKVGSLSAISANMGTITSGSITIDSTGFIRSNGATYGGGSGFWLGYTGGTFKVSIGGLTYDGTTLSVPAASITGTLNASQINGTGLVIRDGSGNVIIGTGASVNPSSYMNVPSDWQNSNLSLSSSGALTSGGTGLGSVTASGIGAVKTDLTNAPAPILNSNISLTQSGNTYTLANAGSGASVSITGLGYTGALNATADITLTNRNNCTIYGNRIVCNAASNWEGAAFSASGNVGGAYATAMTGRLDRGVMFGLSTDPANGTLNWPRIAYGWYLSADGTCYTVVSGTYAAADANNSTGIVYSVTFDGSKVRWLRNGATYREVALSYTGPFYFDAAFPDVGSELTNCGTGPLSSNSWSAIGGSGKPQDNATVGATFGNNIYDAAGNVVPIDAFRNNMIDLSWWKVNATIPWNTNGEFNQLMTPSSAGIPTDPRGGSDAVWYCREITGNSGSGGGWFAVPSSYLDPSKTYRFVVPVRNIVGTDGSVYWGTGDNEVCDLNTTTVYSNPYFTVIGKASLATDRWYLMVGYVFPYNTTGYTHSGAGVLDCATGQFITAGLNFNSHSTGARVHRAYQYYTSANNSVAFGKPIINLVDGTEPPLSSFFADSATLNKSITVSNPGNTYSINGIGSSGFISISGLGYTGDLNATNGAPAGTSVAGNFPSGASASTVESNASTALSNANNALANRLSKSGSDTLVGPISLTAATAILVGNTNDGLYLGSSGIVGRKAGATTFSVTQNGDATFAGTLAANTVTTENLVVGSVSSNSNSYINGISVYSGANTSSFNLSDFPLFNVSKGSGSVSVVSVGYVRVFCSSLSAGNVVSVALKSYFSYGTPISLGEYLHTYIYKSGDSSIITIPVNLVGIIQGGAYGYPAETYSIRFSASVSSYNVSTGSLISNMYDSDANIRSYYLEIKV